MFIATQSSYRSLLTVLFLSFFFTFSQGFTTPDPEMQDSCSPPSAWVSKIEGSSITFDLSSSGDEHTIQYIRYGGETSSAYSIMGSSHTFPYLRQGTYQFIITKVCSSGTSSIIIDDIIM